ncbi:hypothetical protein GCM10029964_024320 [Kibdelosporangium lantanae]
MTTGSDLLDLSPVIPVVVIDDVADAVPVAEALLAGGIRVIELTLRTPVALEAIAAVHKSVPDIVLGVGTVTSPRRPWTPPPRARRSWSPQVRRQSCLTPASPPACRSCPARARCPRRCGWPNVD